MASSPNVVPFRTPGGTPPNRGEYGGIGQGTVVVTTPDGTEVTVNEDGTVLINVAAKVPAVQAGTFGDNLAETLGEDVLGHIADEVIDGVQTDMNSRADLIDQYEKGVDLLGTRIEDISTPSAAGRSVSKIGHPLLMETMIKYHPLALNTPIPTPDGWTTVGEIGVGDFVFDELGQPVRVIGLSEIELDRPCLRISFDDGFAITTDENHRWAVDEKIGRNAKRWIWEKRDLHSRDLKPLLHSIWLSAPLELPEQELPIDPYIFGMWLGDGRTDDGRITVGFADLKDTKANLSACGALLREVKGNGHAALLTVDGLSGALKAIGVAGNKYIPVAYMRASRTQREALLQGLMDTDGHINKITRQCCFANKNFELIAQVQELLKTLAIKSKILCLPAATRTFPSGKSYACEHSYQLRFSADSDRQIFRLPRKRAIQEAPNPTHARRTKMVKIVEVREVPSVPVRCIAVDSENHLFLAGLGMVPTHNSGAEAELLPAEGPAKVATIGDVSTQEEQLAADFQTDFNYYLTDIATEYYPDTSRMIMHQGYCGNGYKKLFRCPMRDRPVSESVSMLDLIVSEEATDLQNATRVTHQIQMTRANLRRMQIAGRYRDIDLGWSQALPREGHEVVKHSEGISSTGMRPQDLPYILWEVDIDLDAEFYGITGKYENKAPAGLPLPYKVTVEQNTRQVLAIWRNWKDGDKFYRKHNMYVQYGLVPTIGQFNYWGYLQILGNHTRALRAIWRLLIDSGMFSNFPGGVKIKGARTSTNEIAPGPGEWVDIEAPFGTDITKILMPLPYKTVDAVFMQLAEMIEAGAQRVGGAVMLETGEGRANVPVGTIMAQIEIATQVMASIHRRNHRAQKEELCKLRDLFLETPEDLTKLARDPRRTQWVAEEFADLNLVPASDPDIPGQVGRIMQAWALMMVAGQNPMLYDMHEVNERVLRTIRVSDPDNVLKTPDQLAADAANMPPPGPPPKPPDPTRIAAVNLKGQQQQQQGQQKLLEMHQAAGEKAQEAQDKAHQVALESADRAADRASRENVALAREETARIKLQGEQETQRQQIEHERQQADQDRQQQYYDNQGQHYDRQVAATERAKTAFDFPA